MSDNETPEKDPKTGRFVSGNIGGPGRPKGSRNILSDHFFKVLAKDFQENGEAAIEAMRSEKPNEYARMIASLQSKEMTGEDGEPLFPQNVNWNVRS